MTTVKSFCNIPCLLVVAGIYCLLYLIHTCVSLLILTWTFPPLDAWKLLWCSCSRQWLTWRSCLWGPHV